MDKNSPIGVFDSGVGGLTVTNSLIDLLPNENFVYLGDTKNCPYGPQTPEQIRGHVSNAAKFLVSKGVKAIVIACNTATAYSDHLKDEVDVPVIGVIAPTANAALKATKNNKIALLATQATVNSKNYHKILEPNGAEVFGQPCPSFVLLVEAGKAGTEESFKDAEVTLAPVKDSGVDTVILGCTHFPLVADEVKHVMGDVKLVESGVATAHE